MFVQHYEARGKHALRTTQVPYRKRLQIRARVA